MNTMKHINNFSAWTGILLSLWSVNAWSTPAMSVLTVNSKDPAAYMQWVQKSGPAIAESIDEEVGGV